MQVSLKAARINKNLLQKDVAAAVKVNKKTISSWESGKTKPSADKIDALCTVLGVSYDDIKWNA